MHNSPSASIDSHTSAPICDQITGVLYCCQAMNGASADTAASLLATRDASGSESVLPILPGMTRPEVERRLPSGRDGIDVLYDDDRVASVFCRAPCRGPVFGIRLGVPFAEARLATDLQFDTRVTARDSTVTMISHTLAHQLVRLYLSASGDVLAMEIAAR